MRISATPATTPGRDRLDRSATWMAAAALAAFPTVGLLAKHGMSTIAVTLAALLILRALWQRRPELPRRKSALVLALGPIGILVVFAGHWLAGPDCAGCGLELAEAAGGTVVLLILAAGGLAAGLDRPILRRALVLGLSLGLVVAAIELLADAPIYRVLDGRGWDEAIDPARYNRGLIALTLLGLTTVGALWTAGRRPAAGVIAAALGAVPLAGSSQAALLALGVGAAALGISLWRERLARWALTAVTVVVILIAPWVAPVLYDWAEPHRSTIGPGNEHRVELWDHAAAVARERPLTGWGIEAFERRPIAPERLARAVIMTKPESHPHNAALQLWIEGGALAAVLAALFLAAVAATIARLSVPDRPWATALFAASLAPVMVSLGLWQVTYLAMTAMAAFAFAAARDPEAGAT